MKIQWVQAVVLVRDIQNPYGNLCPSIPEPISTDGVELPEIITGERGGVSVIVLRVPKRLGLRKESQGMIEPGIQPRLLEKSGHVGCSTRIGSGGNAFKLALEIRVA